MMEDFCSFILTHHRLACFSYHPARHEAAGLQVAPVRCWTKLSHFDIQTFSNACPQKKNAGRLVSQGFMKKNTSDP